MLTALFCPFCFAIFSLQIFDSCFSVMTERPISCAFDQLKSSGVRNEESSGQCHFRIIRIFDYKFRSPCSRFADSQKTLWLNFYGLCASASAGLFFSYCASASSRRNKGHFRRRLCCGL